jgi:hypothetical protein
MASCVMFLVSQTGTGSVTHNDAEKTKAESKKGRGPELNKAEKRRPKEQAFTISGTKPN